MVINIRFMVYFEWISCFKGKMLYSFRSGISGVDVEACVEEIFIGLGLNLGLVILGRLFNLYKF